MDGLTSSPALTQFAMGQTPRSVRIFGRRQDRENGDICGEYFFQGMRGGYPVYENRRTGIGIRFHSNRWVIDRGGGARDSDVCVAFANGPVTNHPGHTELIWHVWENDARAFSQDSDVVAMEAPECITFAGRKQASANSYVNGKYSLHSCVHGKPAYQHDVTGIIIRFDAEERRWLLTNCQTADNTCIAWAADENLSHPGDPLLQWHFWEPEKNTFIADLSVGFVISPDVVHIIGGGSQAERIQGAYHLVGIHECRPLYSKLGTQVVIRYSQQSDSWLIDCDGLSKPSIIGRMYQWVLTGSKEQKSDLCCAYAAAHGSEHPGDVDLQWYVWDSFGRHKLAPDTMCTSAPLQIQVRGRDASRENFDINGEYQFIGAVNGFPAYVQLGSRTVLYHSNKFDGWILDRQGTRDSDCCTAYADSVGGKHPASGLLSWRVYETSRDSFVLDASLSVAPLAVVSPQACMIDNGVPTARAAMTKRWRGQEDELGWEVPPPCKMARFADRAGESRWFRAFGA